MRVQPIEALELPVHHAVGGHTREELSGAAQLGSLVVDGGTIHVVALVLETVVPPPFIRVLEEVEQLILRLSLRIHDLLQRVHFMDKCLVGTG